MTLDLRYPNITGKTDAEQVAQMRSYLHQLVDQLNWALNTVESAQGGNTSAVVYQQSEPSTAQEAEETFNSIKALIIKSADIVKAYETTIFSDFNGKYFAESDFGTYLKETNMKVEANSEGVEEHYKSIEKITNKDGTGTLDAVVDYVETTDGYIKRGILADGSIGIEVGETNENGYHRYAQFTSERLTFYDVNGKPVAYIGAGDIDKDDTNCLYVTGKAVFQGAVLFGGYKMETADGLAFTWIGG